jgi:hypothetical protein
VLQEIFGSEFDTVNIFILNTPLATVSENLGKPGKGLTKQEHIFIEGVQGKILNRNYYNQ